MACTGRASPFHEALDSQEAIEQAAHSVLGCPDVFLITAGDMQVLPMVLDVADRFEARPSDAEMAAHAAEFGIQPRGYVMAGATIPGRKPATGEDIRRGLVIKTDPDGEVLWQYIFDVDECELASFSSAVILPEGGYVFVGQATRSSEKYWDMLWLKLTTDETPL